MPPLPVSPWAALQLSGLFAASALLVVRTRRRDREFRLTFLCALPFTALGALGLDYGLRLVPFVLRGFAGAPPRVGGIMAYGALLGLALAHAAGARAFRGRYAAGRALDRAAPSFGLLVAFGRVGCFLTGCEHGRPTSLPWAVRYPADHVSFPELVREGYARADDAFSVGLHPTQLYEAGVGLLAAAVGFYVDVRRKRRGDGTAFAATALTYASGRFLVELLRGDALRGHAGPFTVGQAMSLVLAFGTVAWLLRERKRPKKSRSREISRPTATTGRDDGQAPLVVHPLRALLAAGAPGALALPAGVAALPAVPAARQDGASDARPGARGAALSDPSSGPHAAAELDFAGAGDAEQVAHVAAHAEDVGEEAEDEERTEREPAAHEPFTGVLGQRILVE